ncbi:MAG: hypothetical protein KAI29_16740, partial [Cyclobacteriaceae bacterium]|nr:hypothetical protein [Cyclobacteriaceae bacterium]
HSGVSIRALTILGLAFMGGLSIHTRTGETIGLTQTISFRIAEAGFVVKINNFTTGSKHRYV